MSQHERTNWRDQALSLRHRLWGFDAPGVDVDWLVIEYDHARAIALIDYKESRSPKIAQPTDANTRAIGDLATRAGLPSFIVRYRAVGKTFEFFVIATNEIAQAKLPAERRMDELDYVRWIYQLRQRKLPDSVKQAIEAAS